MSKYLPLAAALLAFTVARADEPIRAPVPKAPVSASIDGKYVLVATHGLVTPTPAGGGFGERGGPGGGWAGPGGDGDVAFGSPRTFSARAETVISKTEIVIDPRSSPGLVAGGGLGTTMQYTLDATKTPIAIDVEIVPVRGKKMKKLGVVDITGNRLVIALAKDGAERPKSIDEAEGVTVYYFQKAPPPPRTEFRIVALTVGKEEAAEKELNQLAKEGFELVSTTNPTAPDAKASVTTVHFILKRVVK